MEQKIIQKKLVVDIINLFNHAEKKLVTSGLIIIRIPETEVLVQKDIIIAKIINLFFLKFFIFIFYFIKNIIFKLSNEF